MKGQQLFREDGPLWCLIETKRFFFARVVDRNEGCEGEVPRTWHLPHFGLQLVSHSIPKTGLPLAKKDDTVFFY